MLLDSLYTISRWSTGPGQVEAELEIDAAHPIFKGHFPGQPVLPGVCMIQMVKEVMEKVTGERLFMHKADNIKFLQMVDPTRTHSLTLTVQYQTDANELSVQAVLKSGDSNLMKINGGFRIVN